MDPRIPNESASSLMAEFALNKVQNPLYQFLELALSSEDNAQIQEKINRLIQEGYDINFSSLCNIPNTHIYFSGPATLILPFYISEKNTLSACNRLIENGGSINHLAMGFAMSGQVSQAEKLRTQYQADAGLIYMGYVIHDLYRQSNLNSAHLAHPSIIASLEQINHLIDYYEKNLLSPEIALMRKKRAHLKMGDWKTECPITSSFQFEKYTLQSLQKITQDIQSECDYLENYGRSNDAKQYLTDAISAFKVLQTQIKMIQNQIVNQSDLNEINQFLSNTIQSWTSYEIPIPKLLLYPHTDQQGLKAYLEKSKTLSQSDHLLLLFSICETLLAWGKTINLNSFYQNFKSILTKSKHNKKEEWIQQLIDDAIRVGNLAFAKQLRSDFPDCNNRNYQKKMVIAESAGENNLNVKATQHWIYHRSVFEYLPSSLAITETDMKAYFSGVFQRYPEILLSLQHLAEFKPKPNNNAPEEEYRIYIHELFKLEYGQLIKHSCDLTITQALSLTNRGAIILLAQMPINILKQAKIWFNRKTPKQAEINTAWKESILSEAILVKNIMSTFQIDSEEAYYLKKIRETLLIENHLKKNERIDQASPKRLSFPSQPKQDEISSSIQSLIYFLASSKSLHHFGTQSEISIGSSIVPCDVFFCMISYLWPKDIVASPLLDTQSLIKKFVYRENRHLLFSPTLITNPIILENNNPSRSACQVM